MFDTPKIDLEVLKVRLKSEKFDAVINLDQQTSPHIAKLIANLDTPKRIGFAGDNAGNIYNIQISTVSDHNLAGAYDQILEFCDLGPPLEIVEESDIES